MKDLLRIADLSHADLMHLLRLSEQVRQDPHAWPELLGGDTVITYFAKPSTRTRLSFGSAISHLGGVPGDRRAHRAAARQRRDDRGHGPSRESLRPRLRHPHLRRRRRQALRVSRDDPGDQRADRSAPPMPSAGRPAHAAAALRAAARPQARVPRRRQQRRPQPDGGLRRRRDRHRRRHPRRVRAGRRASRRWPTSSPSGPGRSCRSPTIPS